MVSTRTTASRLIVAYQVERWATFEPMLRALVETHWREAAIDQDVIPLDMDWQRYADLDAADILHIVTARTDEEPVGYWTGLVLPHLHYRSTLHCLTDLYYVRPEWRKGPTALRLFGTAHRTLKARGVVKVASGTKVHIDMSKLFEYMDYRFTERLYTKLL